MLEKEDGFFSLIPAFARNKALRSLRGQLSAANAQTLVMVHNESHPLDGEQENAFGISSYAFDLVSYCADLEKQNKALYRRIEFLENKLK